MRRGSDAENVKPDSGALPLWRPKATEKDCPVVQSTPLKPSTDASAEEEEEEGEEEEEEEGKGRQEESEKATGNEGLLRQDGEKGENEGIMDDEPLLASVHVSDEERDELDLDLDLELDLEHEHEHENENENENESVSSIDTSHDQWREERRVQQAQIRKQSKEIRVREQERIEREEIVVMQQLQIEQLRRHLAEHSEQSHSLSPDPFVSLQPSFSNEANEMPKSIQQLQSMLQERDSKIELLNQTINEHVARLEKTEQDKQALLDDRFVEREQQAKEVAQMAIDLSQVQQEVDELQKQARLLTLARDQAKRKVLQHEESVQAKALEVDSLKAENRELRSATEMHLLTIASLQPAHDSASEAMKVRFRHEAEKQEMRMRTLDREIITLKQKLQNQILQARQDSEAFVSRAEHDVICDRLRSSEQQLKESKQEAAQLLSEVNELSRTVDDIRTSDCGHIARVRELQSQCESDRATLLATEQRLSELEGLREREQQQWQSASTLNTVEFQRLRYQIQDGEAHSKVLEERLDCLTLQHQEKIRRIEELERQAHIYKQQEEAGQIALSEHEEEIERLRRHLHGKEESICQLQRQTLAVEAQLANTVEASARELADARQGLSSQERRIQEFDIALKNKEKECARLQHEVEALSARIGSEDESVAFFEAVDKDDLLLSLNERWRKYFKLLQEARTLNQHATNTLVELREVLQRGEHSENALIERVSELQNSVTDKQHQIEQLGLRQEEHNSQLTDLQDLLHEKEIEVSVLQSQVAQHLTSLKRAKEWQNSLKAQCLVLSEQLDSYRSVNYEKIKSQLRNLKRIQNQFKKEITLQLSAVSGEIVNDIAFFMELVQDDTAKLRQEKEVAVDYAKRIESRYISLRKLQRETDPVSETPDSTIVCLRTTNVIETPYQSYHVQASCSENVVIKRLKPTKDTAVALRHLRSHLLHKNGGFQDDSRMG